MPLPATLSVVIPAYNVRPFLREAVLSALGQTWRDLEVIVVDDGSTDGSVETLADIVDRRLRIVRQANSGLAGARNTGIVESRGQFIGFLDGDDIWYPEKAAKQLALMEEDRSVGVSFSFSLYLREDGTVTRRLLSTSTLRPTLRDMIIRNHVGNGSSAIVRAECFTDAGMHNEQLRPAGEDYEMWIRILCRTGVAFACVPEPLSGYRIRTTSLSHNAEMHAGVCIRALEAACEYSETAQELRSLAAANHYRINARKAVSAGDRPAAWKLFRKAVVEDPRILWSDYRTLGTLGLILLHGVYDLRSLSTSPK